MPFKLVRKVFAQVNIGDPIENPLSGSYGSFETGFIPLFTNILRLIFVVAGIWSLMNFIMAGFAYMTAGGDAKKLEQAWAKIWQTLIGLIIIVGSFVFAALIGQLFFGRWDYILNPVITTASEINPNAGLNPLGGGR